jgi:hypothetical protein
MQSLLYKPMQSAILERRSAGERSRDDQRSGPAHIRRRAKIMIEIIEVLAAG